MPNADDIFWFKKQFRAPIEAAVAGTVFDIDMVTAIACQETGYIWQRLRKKPLSVDQILALCVGDTIDSSGGRSAFPQTKADLIAQPNGQAMFNIARKSLDDLAAYFADFQGAASKPSKFCHGFGVFQYDLQFFKDEPDYFLQRKYEDFDQSLGKCLKELNVKLKKIGFQNKPSLTDLDFACVAIAYNTGNFKPNKGLKQGHFNGERYYGEEIYSFVQLARTVALPGVTSQLSPGAPGSAILPQPTPVAATGPFMQVNTQIDTLRLRNAPKLSSPPTANVIADLPDGHPVRAVNGNPVQGFLEIETSLNGANLRGFASAQYLKAAPSMTSIPVEALLLIPPSSGIVAVDMPRPAGMMTTRKAPAGAHSLNEPEQPGRAGTTPGDLCGELAAIIDWLAVEKASHKRYQPHDGLTFCNIYAHDYCYLAGAYLPRVWWTPRAIERLSLGETVTPQYGATISELRANDLFRWLRDFGGRFGWRQTGTLTKLQQAANEGGIGLIVARRTEDGRSGHVVAVAPETDDERARRSAQGDVIAPLQSQAGTRNFSYGTGSLNWWQGA